MKSLGRRRSERNGWRMNCDVDETTEGLENELWRRQSDGRVGSCNVGEVTVRLENKQSSSFNLSVTSPSSQFIFQPFRRFTYVTAHSPTLPSLYLRHSSFSNPSFASPTSQALHLRHLASRPCLKNQLVSDKSLMLLKPETVFTGNTEEYWYWRMDVEPSVIFEVLLDEV